MRTAEEQRAFCRYANIAYSVALGAFITALGAAGFTAFVVCKVMFQ